MSSIETEILIEAAAPAVWRVLSDFAAYPEWCSIVRLAIRGERAVGRRAALRVKLPPGFMVPLPVRLASFDPDRRLAWEGQLGSPAIFHALHSFTIEAAGAGQSRLLHVEEFRGALAPLLAPQRFLGAQARNYRLMNEELKRRIESTRE